MWARAAHPCRWCGTTVQAYRAEAAHCGSELCRAREEQEARRATQAWAMESFERGGLERHLLAMGMGPDELECTFAGVHPKLWAVVESAVQGVLGSHAPTLGFGLAGGPGVGKSGLLAAVAKDWAHASGMRTIREFGVLAGNWRPVWASWPAKLEELRWAMRETGSLSGVLLDELKECPLLILDDLGAERDTDWSRERLHVVLQARTVHRRAVCWTTNLSGEELVARCGKPIISRLLGLAPAARIPDLPDRRRSPFFIPKEGKGSMVP